VRSAQEDYTSCSGENLTKMRVGILNLIRIMECLQGNASGWVFDRRCSKAYVLDYQAAERVCNKDDGAIPLCKFEF